jgi:putative CocE/NonD family hydrolase
VARWLCAEPDGRNSARELSRIDDRRAKPIVPGKVYEYKIDLWSTSNVFLKGHRIRLEVSSSNFPRFDRNLNTGKRKHDANFVKATNTILHDAAHPSALILPVVPR